MGSRQGIGRFGLGIYVATLFGWVLTTSDRYLVQHYLTLSAVGLYAMNYGLWSLPYQILNGWLDMSVRARTYTQAARNDWAGVQRLLQARLAVGAALAIGGTVLIYLVGKPIALSLLGRSYWHGRQLMMLIAAGHVFFVLGSSAVTALFAAKNTQVLTVANTSAGVFNLLLNVVLIPRWGIVAAGATTLLSYMLWAAILMLGTVLLLGKFKTRQGGTALEMTPNPAC
jgi:O-antigen/teichoic acid export membrane protein